MAEKNEEPTISPAEQAARDFDHALNRWITARERHDEQQRVEAAAEVLDKMADAALSR